MLDAGATVIAQLRHEWNRELEVICAQSRETIAILRGQVVEYQNQIDALVGVRLSAISNGRDGEPGRNGADGAPGDRGVPGDVGPPGPQGVPGEPGRNGDVGPPGPQGRVGEPGLSVKGEPGVAGERGDPGEPGRNGERGLPGDVGQPGPIGPTGTQGPKGDAGEPGRNGQQGPAGEKGMPGAVGPTGPQGSKGDAGDVGRNGDVGPAGPQGPRGEPGLPGMLHKVFQWEDRVFYLGQLATFGGATWQALRDTAKQPGRSDDWMLIAAAGANGASFNIRGTYSADETYRALDVVTLDHGWFVAKKDNPGAPPGPDWQSGPVGKRGEKGMPGERGPAGPRGEAAPHWVGVKIEGYSLIAVMSDGTFGARFSLKDMFDTYDVERMS